MDKKTLKEQYKQMKPEMGVFAFKCKPTGKSYIGYGQNIKGDINSITFQLKLGSYPYANLQADWKKYGEDEFEMKILEKLDYDENDFSKTDYSKDLKALLDLVTEELTDWEKIKY